MHPEMEKYYATHKFFLTRIGIWPYESKVLKILMPCLLSMVQYTVYVIEGLLLYDTWGDINIAVECIVTITVVIAANIKLINIVVNNDKFQRLLQLMNEHWEIFNTEFECRILRYYANIGQKITSYFAVYIITTLALYLLIPLIPRILDIVIPLNESRPLAYVFLAEYRVDKEKYYYLILFHSYFTSTVTLTILFTIDTTYMMCVLHGCSLFTAVSQRLENITGETDTKPEDGEKTNFYLFMEKHNSAGNDYRELMICLKKHQVALEHAQILDAIFTDVTFMLLFLNVMLLSVIGIQILNNMDQTNEIIRYVFVTSGVFIHLICMCIPGQLLIDQSTEIFDKAYGSTWYTFSIKTRRLLRVLLYRSLTPCTLTAGKTFVMSMAMCSSVLQTAMSYFTAFLSMK